MYLVPKLTFFVFQTFLFFMKKIFYVGQEWTPVDIFLNATHDTLLIVKFSTVFFSFLPQTTQSLPVPAISVWSVLVLPNGDIAAGCSDGNIWIFSTDEKRQAEPDLMASPFSMALFYPPFAHFLDPSFQAVYESELAKFQRPAQTELEGIKTSDLPGPAALLSPGTRDGQTKMVKDGAIISVHSWSQGKIWPTNVKERKAVKSI